MPSQQPPMDAMPPMDMGPDPNMGMGGGMPNDPGMEMGGMPNDPNMGMMGNEPNAFDTNFDAGVEADEQQDPKRYIQQLTGKLSQTLRNYNDNQPQPDADLSKYVAGMIVKQAIEGLSQEDVTDILNKVKSDEPMDNEPQDGEAPQGDGNEAMPPMQGGEAPMGGQQPQQPGMMESYRRRSSMHRRQLGEVLTNDPINVDDNTTQLQTIRGGGYRQSPYQGPNFRG